jgi:hypothetical protein
MPEIVTIYNRPAKVEAQFSEVVRVRYQDTGTIDYVPSEKVV